MTGKIRTRRGTVLIVDDDPDIREILGYQLTSLGHKILFAGDVPQAIERLKTDHISVVILDLMLPGPNGLDLLRYIREKELNVETIVLTAYASLESATEAIQLGACDYLTKPFDVESIRLAVSHAMEKWWSGARMAAVYEFGRRVALMLDVPQVANAIIDTVKEVLGSCPCRLWVVDEEQGELHLLAACGALPEGGAVLPLYSDGGLAVAAARGGETIYVPDVREDSRCRPTDPSTRSALAVPLMVNNRVIGVLEVEDTAKGAFTSDDVRLLSILAAQAAAAIERARLYRSAQRRAQELDALYRAAQALSSTLNLQQVLTQLLKEIKQILGAKASSVLLYDADREGLIFIASSGPASSQIIGVCVPADAGVAGWVFRRGQSVLLHDAQSDPRFSPDIDALTGPTTHSLLAVPLVYRGRSIGVIEVVGEEKGAFNEHHLRLLGTLAGPAAAAIENARLHEETTRLLAESHVLQEVTLAAASTLDFDQVLTRTIQAIRRVLGTDYLAFALPNESGEGLTIHPSIVGFIPPSEALRLLPLEQTVFGRVYTSGQPELVKDLAGSVHLFQETPGLRSMLAVPVKVEGQVIAVLGVGSLRPDAFDEDDLRLFEAISAQLGIALENARLYEAERELRRLVEQSRAQLVLNERLATTGRLAASLAHEINNPLQVIHNTLQIMLSFSLDPEEQQEYLQIASEEVRRLIDLVNQMLSLARHPCREMRPTSVDQIIERALFLCGKYLQHHRIAVRRDLAADLPPVMANANELVQVFLNIILNGADAMPDGGTLTISTRRAEDGGVLISFADTGRGIRADHIDRIFEPFFTTKEEGSGLGLSLSRDIIRRHGGEITVRSVEGEGTTFTIWLPSMAHREE